MLPYSKSHNQKLPARLSQARVEDKKQKFAACDEKFMIGKLRTF